MKKSILWMKKSLLLTLLALSFSVVRVSVGTASSQTNSTTTVYLDPPTITGVIAGQNFTVNVKIRNAYNVRGWGVAVTFNATVLNCTGQAEGPFLKSVYPDTFFIPGDINNVAGVIGMPGPIACSFLGDYRASGNGTLAIITFKVKAPGVSDLHLRDVEVWGVVDDTLIRVPINIIDVYTVVLGATRYTVVTVSNSTGKTGAYSSGFYDHAFSMPNKEIGFKVTGPYSGFSNVTIPKALLSPEPLYGWGVIVDGRRLRVDERTITENATHTSIYFTYTLGIHTVQITTRFLRSTISITLSSPSACLGWNITISGAITPARANVTVTILYRYIASVGTWTTLATVRTDLNGNYNYTWAPETVGTYEFKASWEGDVNTLDAVSEVSALDAVIRDIEVSLEAPSFIRIGFSSWLNATVHNSGTFNETDVKLQLLINGVVRASNDTISLPIGESYTLSYLWTPPPVEAMYNVTAYAPPKIVSGVGAENDTTNNVATKFVRVRSFWITIECARTGAPWGSIGDLATVEGFYFPNQTQVLVTFNDMRIGYATTDEVGYFNFTFNIPVSAPGTQKVKAFYTEINYTYAMFTVIDVTPLDIEIDVGTAHFRGESAEFYIQVTFKGVAVNATSISALLYKPDGTTEALTVPPPIATGFYKITYALPGDALNGTYALVIEASYTTSTIESSGTSFKTFLLSLTLMEELAQIEALIKDLEIKIEDLEEYKIDAILLAVGEIQNKIKSLNATLLTINATLMEELALRLAAINTTLTEELALRLAAINATLQSINETISQLETRVDTVKGAQEAFAPPLYGAMALALIAAVGAILSSILLRRKTPAKS